jgi:hypothetical protein
MRSYQPIYIISTTLSTCNTASKMEMPQCGVQEAANKKCTPTNLASRVFTERKDYGLKPTQRRQGYF